MNVKINDQVELDVPLGERETVINYYDADRKVSFYSCVPKHIRKVIKLAKEHDEVVVTRFDKYGIKAIMPEKCLKLSAPRKMSEEAKRAGAERLAQMRANKLKEQEEENNE